MKAKNLSLQNYQLSDENIFDFMKIMSMLKSNNSNQKFVCSNIFKKYKYSLFSPILSYIIEYIKENGEKTGYIGKSSINDINILYCAINRKIYDLFLKRENGQIDEKETEIKFSDIKDENYYMIGQNEEETLDFDTLKRIATDLIDEDDISLKDKDLNTLEKLYVFKKREAISTFRLGYSTQERFITMLIENKTDKLVELPNIIFFSKRIKE